jgi:hypothetical protein
MGKICRHQEENMLQRNMTVLGRSRIAAPQDPVSSIFCQTWVFQSE